MRAVYESTRSAPLVERAREVVENGYDAFKVVFIPYTPLLTRHCRRRPVAPHDGDAARAPSGPTSRSWSTSTAVRPRSARRSPISRRSPDARIMFVEEPVPPEESLGLAAITAPDSPVADRRPASVWSGAASSSRRSGPAPSTSPSPTSAIAAACGKAKKIAAMAETAGVGVAPHNPLGPIAGVAALHFAVSTPNVIIQEEMSGAVPWYVDVVAGRSAPAWTLGQAAEARPRHRGRRGGDRRASLPARHLARHAAPSCPTARWWTGERDGRPSPGQARHRHRRRARDRRGDRPRCSPRTAPASSSARSTRRPGRPSPTRSSRPAASYFVQTDVTDEGERRRRLADTTRRRHAGGIDILVNNAGTNVFYEPLDMPEEEWRRCFDLDLDAAWSCSRAVLPAHARRRRRRDRQHRQHHSFKIIPHCFPYPVAKHALIGLTRALAIEYAARGIRVNAIAPGYIETPIARGLLDDFPDPAAERARRRGPPSAEAHRPARGGRPYGGVPRLGRGAVHQCRDHRRSMAAVRRSTTTKKPIHRRTEGRDMRTMRSLGLTHWC